ncbi:MAG TPA: DUF998 domain-containing protein [Ktedonobacteraceae bacterium]|nr:DUF998 domain-containing protein [Ktedonobacteraceae bacterium]
MQTNYAMSQNPVTRLLLACGAIGSLLFILVFLIEGATRPGYSAWHNFVSSLSLSDQGWEQIANFLVCGILMLLFAIGLRQVFHTGRSSLWGPTLMGIFGLALVVAGIFVTDGSLGYPPGAHGGTWHQTLHGTIHGLAGLVTFTSLAVACFVMARRFAGNPNWKGWALYSIVTGVIVEVSFIASTTVSALDQSGILPGSPTGLLQRIGIIAGWSWIALLAIRLLRREMMVETNR